MDYSLKLFKRYSYEIIAVLIISSHFLLSTFFFEPAYSTPDAHGYYKQAQLIADHGKTWIQKTSPIQYVNFIWLEAAQGDRYYSRYPFGLPIIISIFYKLFSPGAGTIVNFILTTLTLLGVFILCRVWIGRGWALVATLLLACNPIINTEVVMGYAHAATAFFFIWGLVFLARWKTTKSFKSAFLSGFLVGCIPAIRYSEVLLGLGIAIFILLHLKEDTKAWPSAAAAVIGAMIPILCLIIHNYLAFGAIWKTPYSLSNEQTQFSIDYILYNLGPYLKDILFYGAGLMWFFGLVGLGMLCANKNTLRQGILFVLLVFPTTLLYLSYYFRLEYNPFATMRFLIPTFYVYAIAAIWGLKIIIQRWKKTVISFTVLLLVVNTLWGIPQSLVSMVVVKDANASLCEIENVVNEHVKPGSFIIAPKHVHQYLDYLDQWQLVDNDVIEAISYEVMYIIQRGYIINNGKIEGIRTTQESTRDKSRAGSLRAISHFVKRKLHMVPYMLSDRDRLSEEFLNELDLLNKNDNDIYIIGHLDKIKDKMPSNDTVSVVKTIEPPPILFWTLKEIYPLPSWHLDLLKARLWNGIFFFDRLVATPLGIIEMMHNYGGLQLIKWTRNTGNP